MGTTHKAAVASCARILGAIAILGRLAERYPDQFGKPQHSIVQRLLKALRIKAAGQLIATDDPATIERAAALAAVRCGLERCCSGFIMGRRPTLTAARRWRRKCCKPAMQ
jgi:hypothetical protein